MAKRTTLIQTPRGAVIQTKSGKIELQWNKNFAPKWTNNFQKAQAIFDEEVLRLIEPYVPYDTHMLARSALIASDIGGGELIWSTPYAGAQYYTTADSRPYSSLAGGHWGDRCKADNLPHLQSFAKKAVKK